MKKIPYNKLFHNEPRAIKFNSLQKLNAFSSQKKANEEEVSVREQKSKQGNGGKSCEQLTTDD